jgi:hypothetical protein
MIDESGTPDGKGKFNHFSNEGSVSSIYWTPETGAHEIHGAIRDRWSQLGWEGSFLGYPTSDETDNPDNESTGRGDRYSLFQGGFISWSEHGAHEHRTGTQHAFKVDRMFISVTRSGEVIGSPQDTDVISLQVKVGAQEVEPIFRTLGEFGDGGPYNIGISLPFTADDPAAPVVASFQLANSEKGDTEELKQTMKDAFKEVSSETASAGGAAIGGAIGGIGGPIGAGIGALVGAVAGKLVDAFYADCDGLVATDAVYVSGATLNDNVATGPHIETKEYPGTDSPVGCGDNSHYQVTWQVS